MSGDWFDPYRTLGVSRDSDRAEIDAVWAERVRRAMHSQDVMEQASLNKARSILKDPGERAAWDLAHPVFPLDPKALIEPLLTPAVLGLPPVMPDLTPLLQAKPALPTEREVLRVLEEPHPMMVAAADPQWLLDYLLSPHLIPDPWASVPDKEV